MAAESTGRARLRSMSGIAQVAGTTDDGRVRWTWDMKTLNGKGLDIRLRLPPGLDGLELEVRRRIAARLSRGTCHAGLTIVRSARSAGIRLDRDKLDALIAAVADIALPSTIAPATLDGLLAQRGVIESGEDQPDDGDIVSSACLAGLDRTLDALVAMREGEGANLRAVLEGRLDAIEALVRRADDAPERRPDAIRRRLGEALALLDGRAGLDPARLHGEAMLLAVKADVREELDRLIAHLSAARALFATDAPIGRRLDFLAQEFGREASTFCAKSNAAALTAIGLDLRVEIEQFREQVQNVE